MIDVFGFVCGGRLGNCQPQVGRLPENLLTQQLNVGRY